MMNEPGTFLNVNITFILSIVSPDVWLHYKTWPRINLAQNEQAYEMMMFIYNDNRIPLISKLTELLFCNFLLLIPLLFLYCKATKTAPKFFPRSVELSLEMLMTDLNIWISNNSKTYHLDQTHNMRQVAWQKYSCWPFAPL